jgi:hypothetical protein
MRRPAVFGRFAGGTITLNGGAAIGPNRSSCATTSKPSVP